MGRVVKLERAETPRASSGARPVATRRGSVRRRSARGRASQKTALVLGGGGFTGAVYEIGALRALDLLSVNRTVNEFDVYVGTSAGAFIASLCVNGVTPEEMMRVLTSQGPHPFRGVGVGELLRPNVTELARTALRMPGRLASFARQVVARPGDFSLMDLVLELAEGLPSGLYTGSGLEAYVRRVLSDPDRTDDFRDLHHELYLTATDLDTCERIVFGRKGFDEVPISTAVCASGALPMVYSPVPIDGRELVDGGLISTTNLDIAVEAGAELVIVINPMVPYVNDFSAQVRTLGGRRPRRISDMGFPRIGYQAFKLLAHQRLHELAGRWSERYPGVDILLIEPESSDELMFQTPIMSFSSRIEIARHGFESVTYHLAGEYERYDEVFKRHGIEISPERVHDVIERLQAEPDEQVSAWRKILESTTGALLRQAGVAS